MREERGHITGDVVVAEPMDLWGSIVGKLTVLAGGKVYVRGNVCGDLHVDDGGRVHIYGNVTGNLILEEGAKVIHSGMVGGDAVNNGGRLYIEAFAKVLGKVKRKAGETNIDPKAQIREV